MTVEKLNQIKNAHVLIFGDYMIDKYIYGKVTRISPEAPVPVLRVTKKQVKFGGAGNVVNNVINLGAKVRVLGCVGSDTDGDWIITEFMNNGIETDYIQQHSLLKTISKTRLASKNQQFLRYDEEIIQELPSEYITFMNENKDDIFKDIQVVIISDYGKGAVTEASAQFLISNANKRGIPVVVDPKGKDYSKYTGSYACTPNVKELGDVIGKELTTEDDLTTAGIYVKKTASIKNLLLTRSEKGISLFDNEGSKKDFPALSKDVVDVTGAGDTVVCVISLMLVAGFSLDECCILANIAASIVCSKFGAATVSLNELMEQIVNSGEFKLVDVKTAKYVLASLREKGKKIVFTNGCFDLLHMGHLSSFLQARTLGDILVVAVNSDKSVKRLKGELRPIINEKDRIAMLCALDCVDYVILMEDDTPVNLIKELKPEITVKGRDWENKYLPERDIVEEYGGQTCFIDLEDSLSTTNIIEKIRNVY